MKPITNKRIASFLTLLLFLSLWMPLFSVPASAAPVNLMNVMDAHAYKDETILGDAVLPYRIYLPDSLAASFPAGADNASVTAEPAETDTEGNPVEPKPAPEPIAPPEGSSYGLLIWLHDEDGRGDDNVSHISDDAKNGLINAFLNDPDRAADTVIIAPQCPKGKVWLEDGSRMLAQLQSLLENYILKLNIDPDRIMIGGISMGADAAYDLLSLQNEHSSYTYAAAYLVGGVTSDTATTEADAEPYKNTAVYAFLSENDTVTPPDSVRNLADALIGYGCTFNYAVYPELGHEVWHQAFVEAAMLDAFIATNAPTPEPVETAPVTDTEPVTDEETDEPVATEAVTTAAPETDAVDGTLNVGGFAITNEMIAYTILGAACILTVVMLVTGVIKNNKVR